ncbi:MULTISPECIES: vWA domain-containing protein [Streptomyces]|uniref:VWA domain-containing protein n=1 Tax=Streptomyces tsukubensis (strain DSM 42081 / NBRC 108919 / NRRL 18488 / 9993) TaxID=1114943 RepID=I2MUK9_STRT9|nr:MULTISPECIES: VWA domain-containing protein [Streptomyces]AZK92966.1 VWA domain-containing protein [Streptomyces tsukubensis]EIF88456.1 von Willebrand factor type A [Streptomyces tsukubensis NRRL18488]MYS64904.1 VWA domain-containing protein [Streptomyces sp. SID5473]QKM70873.1 VWA domain-containing protein [Streptomyces tsukubensis NRRL18488]TAI41010.1 VWA domain-containing protein [Streptomyces tsukubensis]
MTADGIGFGTGYDERQPVVLLLDTSASMGRPEENPRIDELNAALAGWFDGVRAQERLRTRVEVCLITFDSAVRVHDPAAGRLVPVESADPGGLFVPVDGMRPPTLRAGGLTRLTEAVEAALELARARRRTLQRQRVPVRRPFLWVLTDGAPSDDRGRPLDPAALAETAERVRRGEAAGEWVFQVIGVRGADLPMLRVIAPKATSPLESLDFGRILDLLFQSTDDSSPDQAADLIHQQVNDRAARLARMDRLERDHR